MTTKLTERDVVNIFLNSQTNGKVFFVEEVPVFIQSVDVVKISKNMRTITAIEFKKDKWRKAIEQVLAEKLVFDYLEIAVLHPKRESTCLRIEERCKELGLGLYYIDSTNAQVIHKIKPMRNSDFWPIQRKVVKKYLQERISNGREN